MTRAMRDAIVAFRHGRASLDAIARLNAALAI